MNIDTPGAIMRRSPGSWKIAGIGFDDPPPERAGHPHDGLRPQPAGVSGFVVRLVGVGRGDGVGLFQELS